MSELTAITTARRLARAVKHGPDRMLHPLRRRRAVRRLGRRPMPRRFLFICHGNICRSPYAEHAFARDICDPLRHLFDVSSAGFIGPERPSPPNARDVAADRGVDLTAHRAQLFSREQIEQADVVLVMTPEQHRALSGRFPTRAHAIFVLGDLDPEPIDTRTIRDPVEQNRSVFEQSYARIDRCNQNLLEATGICSSALHQRADEPTADLARRT